MKSFLSVPLTIVALVAITTIAASSPVGVIEDAPTGLFCGKKLGIISENMTIYGNNTFEYHNLVTPPFVKKIHINCYNEKFIWDSENNELNLTAAASNPNDCLTKAAKESKSGFPTFTFDGTNINSKNKFGSLKMKPSSTGSC